MQPNLFSAHWQAQLLSGAHLQHAPRSGVAVHVRGWNLALNSFGLLQLRVSPGLVDVARERASHVSIPEQNLALHAWMSVQFVGVKQIPRLCLRLHLQQLADLPML